MYEDTDRRDGFLDPLSMLRDGASEQIEFESPEVASLDVKHVAKVVGADLVGIAPFDDRWTYTERFSVQSGGRQAERSARRPDPRRRDRAVDGPRPHPHRPVGVGRHGDRAGLLARLGRAVDDRPVHPQPRISGDPVNERHRPGDPVRARSRSRRVRAARAVDHSRSSAHACGSARSSPTCRSPATIPSRSVSNDSARAAASAPMPAPPRRFPAGSRPPSVHNTSNITGVRKWSVDGVEVLRILVEGEHRLLGLHPGLPIQPRLLQAVEPMVGEARSSLPQVGAATRRTSGTRQTSAAQTLVAEFVALGLPRARPTAPTHLACENLKSCWSSKMPRSSRFNATVPPCCAKRSTRTGSDGSPKASNTTATIPASGPTGTRIRSSSVGFWTDYVTWKDIPEYRQVVFESGLGQVAAQLMQSKNGAVLSRARVDQGTRRLRAHALASRPAVLLGRRRPERQYVDRPRLGARRHGATVRRRFPSLEPMVHSAQVHRPHAVRRRKRSLRTAARHRRSDRRAARRTPACCRSRSSPATWSCSTTAPCTMRPATCRNRHLGERSACGGSATMPCGRSVHGRCHHRSSPTACESATNSTKGDSRSSPGDTIAWRGAVAASTW